MPTWMTSLFLALLSMPKVFGMLQEDRFKSLTRHLATAKPTTPAPTPTQSTISKNNLQPNFIRVCAAQARSAFNFRIRNSYLLE